MKLRNKKTGEIGRVLRQLRDREEIRIATDKKIYFVESLSQLADEWEDYIEPETKEQYWFYNTLYNSIDYCDHDETDVDEIKDLEMGNHFESAEEAEEAVEKLKAITRLNKCGFKFEGYADRDRSNGGDIVIYAHVDIPNNNLLEEAQPAMLKDLDLLFGGEK